MLEIKEVGAIDEADLLEIKEVGAIDEADLLEIKEVGAIEDETTADGGMATALVDTDVFRLSIEDGTPRRTGVEWVSAAEGLGNTPRTGVE